MHGDKTIPGHISLLPILLLPTNHFCNTKHLNSGLMPFFSFIFKSYAIGTQMLMANSFIEAATRRRKMGRCVAGQQHLPCFSRVPKKHQKHQKGPISKSFATSKPVNRNKQWYAPTMQAAFRFPPASSGYSSQYNLQGHQLLSKWVLDRMDLEGNWHSLDSRRARGTGRRLLRPT